jgi:hypothetical protein
MIKDHRMSVQQDMTEHWNENTEEETHLIIRNKVFNRQILWPLERFPTVVHVITCMFWRLSPIELTFGSEDIARVHITQLSFRF